MVLRLMPDPLNRSYVQSPHVEAKENELIIVYFVLVVVPWEDIGTFLSHSLVLHFVSSS